MMTAEQYSPVSPSAERLSDSSLDAFIERILSDAGVAAAGARAGLSPQEVTHFVATYANEARAGLRFIRPMLRPGMRVLEIGCGIGALAAFLLEAGVDVTAIEPGASGFGFMPEIGAAILEMVGASRSRWLPIVAEKLDPKEHGQFDLIFSINVIEHIPDVDGAFQGMASVLAPTGSMIHLCPNYTVPYEPHFGIPLVPFFPGVSRFLFPKTLKKYPGIWEELNFITSRRVKRLARANGLKVCFVRGMLAENLRRLEADPIFRQKQRGLAAVIGAVAIKLGLAGVAEKIPGELMTPMLIHLTRHE